MKRIIIYLIVTSLLSSNILWAGEGQLDNMLDNLLDTKEQVVWDVDNSVMHHLVDKHNDGHDCHMSAHLTALNITPLSFADFTNTQQLPLLHVRYSTLKLPPPNKPPRT